MMNSRERVLTALNHEEPDRVPIDFGSFPGATSINVRAYQLLLEHFGLRKEVRVENILMFTAQVDDEILDRFHVDTKSLKPSVPLAEFNAPEAFVYKPFDVTWRRSTDYTYAPVEGPFQHLDEPTPEDLTKFPWPAPRDLENPGEWKQKAAQLRGETDRALVARLPPGIVTLAQFQRGFEGWALDLILNRKFSDALHQKLAEIWIQTAELMLDALGDNVDILMFGDDFGEQDRLMLSPKMFRERVKPLMKQMIDSVRAKSSAKIALHSCGSVYELIEDFIDIGIDVLNPLQATAKDMEPEKLKCKAGRDLALWGGIDSHFVLTKGTPEEVKEEVKRKIDVLAKDGGYILSADHNILIDVPPQNLEVMFQAAHEFGRY
jgi:uroporphyrinogen decarboxylase